ncbi:MAG: hypothetical protein MJ072_06675, partial [Clostridia bacterium]|nr:hypothetical protein [Clostridia bacterium]
IGDETALNLWKTEGHDGYVKPHGHDYHIEYDWNKDECTAKYICSYNCGVPETIEEVTASFVTDTPATCTAKAKGHYKATFTNALFSIQETEPNSVEDGNPLGHKYDITYTWKGSECTATAVCERDESHVETETVIVEFITTDTPATCVDKAIGYYKATFTNPLFSEQNSESFEYGNPLGHDFSNYVSNNDATCEHDGTKTRKCSRCVATDTVTDEGSKLEHDYKAIYNWDGNECTAIYCCTYGCGIDEVPEKATGEFVKDADATCTNKAKGHYKATFKNPLFSEQNTENSSVEVGYFLEHIDEDGDDVCDVCKLKYEYYYYDTVAKEYKKALAPITEINEIDENTDEFTSGFNIVTESI